MSTHDEVIPEEELPELIKRAGQELYGEDDITFEVVASVRAVRGADKKVVEGLVGPILLYRGDSLYRAMFVMGMACEVEEFMPDVEQLGPAAMQVVDQLRAGKFTWRK